MLKEFLKYVVDDLSQIAFIQEGSHTFTAKPVHYLSPPLPKPVEFNTLSGFAAFVGRMLAHEAPADGMKSDMIVRIINPNLVVLESLLTNDYNQRPVIAQTSTGLQGQTFKFGEYMSQEDFLIGLRMRFVSTFQIDRLIQLIGNISLTSNIEVSDDGFTQSIGQKAGVVLKSRAELPSEITLAPYRTFLDTIQPESPFFVRAQKNGRTDMPELALFECDGGQWKLAAMHNILATLIGLIPSSVDVIL